MRISGAVYFFAHGLLLTVLSTSCLGQTADPVTEKPDEFSLFADLQQQITELKIQMSKVMKDKTKCESEIKSIKELHLADRTEMKSLTKKILAIESVFSPNIWMIQPSTGPSEGQGLKDTDLSEIKNTLSGLQGKVLTLVRQVSGIDNKVFFGKSCDTLTLSEGSPKKWTIYPNGIDELGVEVLCGFETDGGAWTFIQKRGSGPKDEFYRNWTEYENGFGSLDGNFWVGLKTIYDLTKDGDQELRIDLWDFEDDHAYAKYSNFFISDSSDFYRLTIGGYSGTSRDCLDWNNGMRFSTKDKDNDDYLDFNCAEAYQGAWWFNSFCGSSNLNGPYCETGKAPKMSSAYIRWNHWKGAFRCLRQVEMKIRSRR